jgi:6-phospho-3-hexuloisomerase
MDIDVRLILSEIEAIFENTSNDELDQFISEIENASRIVCVGAGRVGLAMQSFSMRLTHLGFQAYYLGETNVPKMGPEDLLIIGSGSGETKTIVRIAEIAKAQGLSIILISSKLNSTIMNLSKASLIIGDGIGIANTVNSIQPMTTLFEQCINLFLDSIVIKLMQRTSQSGQDLASRHNVLE